MNELNKRPIHNYSFTIQIVFLIFKIFYITVIADAIFIITKRVLKNELNMSPRIVMSMKVVFRETISSSDFGTTSETRVQIELT